MRYDKHSDGYELVFVPTDLQREAYEVAIRHATWVNPRTGERERVRVSVKHVERFEDKGWRFCVRTKGPEFDAANTALSVYIAATYPVGTRCRTVVPLLGAVSPTGRPVGTLATVTASEGYAHPLFSFDGEQGGPYTIGPWWLVPISGF